MLVGGEGSEVLVGGGVRCWWEERGSEVLVGGKGVEGREGGGRGRREWRGKEAEGEKMEKGWVSQFERKYGSDEGIDKEDEVGESSVGGGKAHRAMEPVLVIHHLQGLLYLSCSCLDSLEGALSS